MELNGARSNPRLQVELLRLGEIHGRLLARAATHPRQARPAPPRLSSLLEAITTVLGVAESPMRVPEIHAAAQALVGRTLLRTSVKAALSASAAGPSCRFQRVRHGVYQSAINW